MTDTRASVVGGVDTHGEFHVAAAVDAIGGELGTKTFPTTPAGYRQLLEWLRSFGNLGKVGIEGTGSYGAGLTRHLQAEGVQVIEVHRPPRHERRNRGKNDAMDALVAARAVISGVGTGEVRGRDEEIEAIRVLRVARRSARKQRTQVINQLRCLVLTAPDALRQQLRSLNAHQLIATCTAFRPGSTLDSTMATKFALRELARRAQDLEAEVRRLDEILVPLVTAVAPELVAAHGVGPDTAGALIVAAGANPSRLRHEGAFARLCGVTPIPASSGKKVLWRLNRGGDREANSALWRIVLVRMGSDPRTRAYVDRRLAGGRTKREVMRCLKRYVARELFPLLPHDRLSTPLGFTASPPSEVVLAA